METYLMNNIEFRKKVIGCWLGKAAGGTLGQPYEGTEGPLSLSFYDPVPTDMIPNDDLDLQVLGLASWIKWHSPGLTARFLPMHGCHM